MTLPSFIVFLPAVLSGSLVIHLLWPERSMLAFLLKFSLGIGLGLGLSSILYFLVLQVAPGRINMLALQIVLLILLMVMTLLRERGQKWDQVYFPVLSRLQWGLVGAAFLAFLISLLIFINYTISRPQGEYDAWSIWNRAARFIYRDPENWRATLSPDIYWASHADYPLLVPLNVAWGWEVLGTETLRIPMVQAVLFTFGNVGVMFAVFAFTRTIGQASLASLVLMATPALLLIGSTLISDVPIAYFIFASSILIYLSVVREEAALLVLSGFMAGLAGWTKNEGLLFIAVSPLALIVVGPKNIRRYLTHYLAGLVLPLIIILYFKSIAPANDLIMDSDGSSITRITDLSRYWTVLKAFGGQVASFSGWPLSIVGLAIYAVVLRNRPSANSKQGIYAITAILFLQLLGYCAVYVLTPRDLEWQLLTSLDRVIMQVFPLGLFLYFSVISDPESVFS